MFKVRPGKQSTMYRMHDGCQSGSPDIGAGEVLCGLSVVFPSVSVAWIYYKPGLREPQ